LSSTAKIYLLSSGKNSFSAGVCADAFSDPAQSAKNISGWNPEISAQGDEPAVTRKKMRLQWFARIRMTIASGFTWFAREPKLMVGAEGARILTET
jgi:hypothetical protein